MVDEGVHSSYHAKDYILTPTEFYWVLVPPSVAFTRDVSRPLLSEKCVSSIFDQAEISYPSFEQRAKNERQAFDQTVFSSEEDALAAILLSTAYFDEDTLVHEMGSWNGENLIRLLYYSHLQGKTPIGCIGTDINDTALNFAESTIAHLGISSSLVQFHLANVQHPLDFTSLNLSYTKEVKIGLRVIPALDPKHAQQMLIAARASFRSPDSVLVVSYPILKGAIYERNQKRASEPNQNQYRQEFFEGGVVFKTPFQAPEALPLYLRKFNDHDMVINTFYSEESFNKLALTSGLVVKKSIYVGDFSGNYRIVSVLGVRK